MSIRPIDMLSMPNRSQEASQVHQAQNQKQAHAQEQLGVAYNNHVKHDGQKTVKTTKSENHEYSYEDGDGTSADSRQQKKQKKKKEEENKKNIKTSGFDIRI